MNGTWHWNRGSLIDPGFMMNKRSFGRPPPQVRACAVSPARVVAAGYAHAHTQRWELAKAREVGTVHPYSGSRTRTVPSLGVATQVCARSSSPDSHAAARVRSQPGTSHTAGAAEPQEGSPRAPVFSGRAAGHVKPEGVLDICACWAPRCSACRTPA